MWRELTIALIVACFWTVTGPDSIANAQSDCVSEGAVSPSETALVADYEVLLDIRDTLAGTATLDWAADVPIGEWKGIDVTEVASSAGLSGTIPPQLGNLSNLMTLYLRDNQFTGCIPEALRDVEANDFDDVATDSDGEANTAAEQLTLGLPYDDDHDGTISRDEVVTAIADYLFSGLLSRDQVVQIIALYLFG